MAAWQGSLLDLEESLALRPVADGLTRRDLGRGAWLDVRPGWLSGGDELLEHLGRVVPWRAERRQMYDSIVDVPRLTCFYDERESLPHPVLDEARRMLSAHYRPELGEDFATAGLCLYRDGHDSVAWHGDRIGRSRDTDTMIAILSVGADRPLSLRPRGGGASLRVAAGHGDLVVMGGSAQRTFDHAILKTSEDVGPRISIQFRVRGVR
ncbi:MAG: alpha-ketoglutarate-dependent dioxygenase AlkB [Actinobacteria bacterium]|nr:alpha-ketoglutarate-dependent dioxygenase AlkB [Actinomycetota bacterium]